jgi:hypothetical protein
LVTVSVLPLTAKLALPAATEPPAGLASAGDEEIAKAALTAMASTERRSVTSDLSFCPTARRHCSGNRDGAPEGFPYP